MNQNIMSFGIADVMTAAVATGLFVSLCTIQAPDGLLTPSGAPSNTYANVSGLVSIPCMDAPNIISDLKVGAHEVRNIAQLQDEGCRHVLLNDYYAAILEGWRAGWRAVVDGTNYDISGAECDSQRTQVRMELRRVSV